MILKNYLHPVNFLGKRFSEKIVIFESDDWGTEKLRNKNILINALQKKIIDDNPYYKYDCLENNDDLEQLFNILLKHKDSNGGNPVITGNYIVANPDYITIKENDYNIYSYIPTYRIYENYNNHDKVITKFKEAISKKLFLPQYHGREHLDVSRWMAALKNNDYIARTAFDYFFVNISAENTTKKRKSITASFDFDDTFNQNEFRSIINEMKILFFNTFGVYANTFIAPAFTWNKTIEIFLNDIGVKALQGIWKQTVPCPSKKKKYRYVKHYIGEKNELNQFYFVRNAYFEPTLLPDIDAICECLKKIEIAFKFKKPAIVGTHRVNFIGGLDERNRHKNIKIFDELLKGIIKKWPDVEFRNSEELLNIIRSKNKIL